MGQNGARLWPHFVSQHHGRAANLPLKQRYFLSFLIERDCFDIQQNAAGRDTQPIATAACSHTVTANLSRSNTNVHQIDVTQWLLLIE